MNAKRSLTHSPGGNLLLTALAFIACSTVLAPAAAGGPVEDGKALFTQSCAGCHTLGGGDTVGPDLKGVIGRSSEERVRAFIASPDELVASDPDAKALDEKFPADMPDLGLASAQVDALVAYLESEEGAAAPSTGGEEQPAPAGAGDADRGKDLFTGARPFEQGGPACISCHDLAGAGALGGGQVGADLTGSYTKFGGDQGVVSMLATLPFPTMQPIYDGRGLTKQEQVHLAAFLKETAEQKAPGDSMWPLVALGAGGAVLPLALALLVWPRRSLVVRRKIAPKPNRIGRR